MAIIYFSKSQYSFYSDQMPEQLPTDSVLVSQSTYDAVMAELNAGGGLDGDANGQPIVIPVAAASYVDRARVRFHQAISQVVVVATVEAYVFAERYRQAMAYKAAGYPMPLPAEFELYLKETADQLGISYREQANRIIADNLLFHSINSKADALLAKLQVQLPPLALTSQRNAKTDEVIIEFTDFLGALGFEVTLY